MKSLIFITGVLFSAVSFAKTYQPLEVGHYTSPEMTYDNTPRAYPMACNDSVTVFGSNSKNVKNQATTSSIVIVQNEIPFDGKESMTFFQGGIEYKKVYSRQEGFLKSKKVETTYRYIVFHKDSQHLVVSKVRYVVSGVIVGMLDLNNSIECVYTKAN